MPEGRKGSEGYISKLEKQRGAPSLFQLSKTFLIMGLTAYGPVVLQELKRLIVNKKWLSQKEFEEGLGMVQLYPGPVMFNLATYVAYKIKDFLGALTTIFFIIPSYLLVLFLSWIYFNYGSIWWIHPLFTTLDAIVLGIILHVSINFYQKYVNTKGEAIIAGLSFLFILYKFNAFLITAISIILGIVLFKNKLEAKHLEENENKKKGNPLIALTVSGLVFLLLILFGLFQKGPFGELTLSMMKVGSIAFGNGMTIMPFLQQEAVINHRWLTLKEFADGIALGQITPGPILITATFIGYKVAGLAGSTLATAGIFYPSFFYTLVMTEVYDRIKHNRFVTPALKGLLSAFTGMLFFVALSIGKVSLTSKENFIWAVASFIAVRYFRWSVLKIFILGLLTAAVILLVKTVSLRALY